jgi:hypothetical protein
MQPEVTSSPLVSENDKVPHSQTGVTYKEAEAAAPYIVDAVVTDEVIVKVEDDAARMPPESADKSGEQELIEGGAEIAKFRLEVTQWVKGSGPDNIMAIVGLGGPGIGFGGNDNEWLLESLRGGGPYRISMHPNPRYKEHVYTVFTVRPI